MTRYPYRDVLPPAELKKRIQAARILRGVLQVDLEMALAADGLGKTELGRIERGILPLTKVRRGVLANALRVPEEWFLEENVDVIVGMAPANERRTTAGLPPPPGELGHRAAAAEPTPEDRQPPQNQEEEESGTDVGG